MTTRAVPAALAARPLAVVNDYVRLTKPRIISLLLVTTAGAMFVAAGGVPGGWLLFWTMVGGYLAATNIAPAVVTSSSEMIRGLVRRT